MRLRWSPVGRSPSARRHTGGRLAGDRIPGDLGVHRRRRAGSHPNLDVSLEGWTTASAEAADELTIDLPAGINLLPRSMPSCGSSDFGTEECPVRLPQLGLVTIRGDHEGDPEYLLGTAAVYSLTPTADEFGRIGFVIPTLDVPVSGTVGLRSGSDYGGRVGARRLPRRRRTTGGRLHRLGGPGGAGTRPRPAPAWDQRLPRDLRTPAVRLPTSSSVLQTALTEYPTACSQPSGLKNLTLTTHEDPRTPDQCHDHAAGGDRVRALSFFSFGEGSVASTAADTPTGVTLSFGVPQAMSPTTLSGSQLKAAALFFEGGLTIDEVELEGRTECSAAQVGIGTEAAPPARRARSWARRRCRARSPGGGPGRDLLRRAGPEGGYGLWVTASGYGVDLKLPLVLAIEDLLVESEGSEEEVEAAVAEFEFLPQLPLNRIDLELPDGPSSPLVTAGECGEFGVTGLLTPWDGQLSEWVTESTHVIDAGFGGGPCPTPGSGPAPSPPPSTLPMQPNHPERTPKTRILRHPPRHSKVRRATFAFRADVAGSTFRCKLDSSPTAAAPPRFASGLKPGRHVFRAYAVSRAGTRGKVAAFRFKTLARRPHKHR